MKRRLNLEVLDAIRSRRAVREFTLDCVSESQIHRLLEAAVSAPSAMNRQPWAFVVVQDRPLLNQIGDEATSQLMRQPGFAKLIEEARRSQGRHEYDIFHGAGTLIVVCAKPQGSHPDWDCCLAAQNLMLAATELGLGTCVIGLAWDVLNQSKTKALLGIPADYGAVMPIVVGTPKFVPEATSRRSPDILAWRTPIARSRSAASAQR